VDILGFGTGSVGEDGAVTTGGTKGGASDSGDFPIEIESLHRQGLRGDFVFGEALGRATDREPGNTKGGGVTFGAPLEIDDFLPDDSDDPDGAREDAGWWKPFCLGEDVTDDLFPRPECPKFEPLSVETEIFVYWMGGSGTRTGEDAPRGG
jgi:hypothetical protein